MNKKELIKSIKQDLKEIEKDDKERIDEDKLERVENMDFSGTDDAIFDLGMRVALTNIIERIEN